MSIITPAYALKQLMLDASTVTAFIVDRIFPIGSIPQNVEIPYGFFETTDDEGEHHIAGATGLHLADIEFTWVTRSKSQAEDIADAVRLVTDGRPQGVVGVDSQTINLVHLNLEDQVDDIVPPSDGKDRGLTLIEQRFRVGYEKEPATF